VTDPGRKRSFSPVADADTRLLILGSLPGDASLAAGRYYAHPQNGFWRLVGGVIGADLVALDYEDRLRTLLDHGVGLWDVTREAERRGSLDGAIRNAKANDLIGLIETLPSLRTVGFNGGTAARIGRKVLAGREGLDLVDLPSSSPAYTLAFAEKAAAWGRLAL
jgi:hypoxanthine-DNA glycosylase